MLIDRESIDVRYLEQLSESGQTTALAYMMGWILDHVTKEEDIQEFCKKLPRYKRPRKIIFADVPRNPTGKIEKPKLREKYGATHLVAAQNQG